MKDQLFKTNFKGGPLDGITFSVEVGQMVLYSLEALAGLEIKHAYKLIGGEFIYKGVVLS
jgi:hypothetical protein